MADFLLFKMAATRHLGFLEVGNFTYQASAEAQYESSRQILCRWVKPLRIYNRF